MKCAQCGRGETRPGHGTVTLERSATTVVFKKVPAEVCSTCGQRYYDETVTASLLRMAEEAVRAGVQVDVREYVAA